MKGEFYHVANPRHTHIRWALFYVLLFAVVSVGFFYVAGRIHTYSVPSGAIQLSIPYKTYLVGEPITFTLTNSYNSAIYISNDCPHEPLAVYRQQNSKWVRIHADTTVQTCQSKDRQVKVASGGQQSGSYANWPELFAQPGKYRVVAYVQYFDVAPYQDFEIIARPEKPTQTVTTITPKTTSTTNPTTRVTTPISTNSIATTPNTPTVTVTPTLSSKTVSVSNGSIAVQYSATRIYVQSITPASGCTYEGGQSGASVQVTFKCSQTETQVTLSLSNGQIVTRVENG